MTERSSLLPTSGPAPEERSLADEGRLLERHRRGDAEAFAALVSEYRAPVYGYLSRCGVAGVDRDDLFQEIFLKIHRAAGRYREDRPLHPWVFTIVANTVRNHFRKRRVRELVESGPTPTEPADPGPDASRRAEARQSARWLEEEIGRLPMGQRQVLLLVSVESLPLKQVAGILALPLNTVKSRLRRARRALIEARGRRSEPMREAGEESP